REHDFRKFPALKNILMHFLVASGTSAFAARCVDNDDSIRFPRCRVQPDRAALEFERAVNGMQSICEREFDAGFRRIECYQQFLRRYRGREQASGHTDPERNAAPRDSHEAYSSHFTPSESASPAPGPDPHRETPQPTDPCAARELLRTDRAFGRRGEERGAGSRRYRAWPRGDATFFPAIRQAVRERIDSGTGHSEREHPPGAGPAERRGLTHTR